MLTLLLEEKKKKEKKSFCFYPSSCFTRLPFYHFNQFFLSQYYPLSVYQFYISSCWTRLPVLLVYLLDRLDLYTCFTPLHVWPVLLVNLLYPGTRNSCQLALQVVPLLSLSWFPFLLVLSVSLVYPFYSFTGYTAFYPFILLPFILLFFYPSILISFDPSIRSLEIHPFNLLHLITSQETSISWKGSQLGAKAIYSGALLHRIRVTALREGSLQTVM